MSSHKSLTEQAMRYRRDAYVERICKDPPVLAQVWDREADKLLTLDRPPDVGAGGEVVQEQVRGLGFKRACVRDTLRDGPDRIAEEASIRRTDLLMQPNFDCLAMGIDAAESIKAGNSIEKMISHQMAAAHEAAMRMLDRGLSYEHSSAGDQVEAVRCTNAAARLMSAFNDGALTLQRLRTGGSQTVTVQHVTVTSGGQAVIGNVQPGEGKHRRGGTDNG